MSVSQIDILYSSEIVLQEPLLYRCLIHIRLLRGYNRAISKKPIYTHMDILSDKMSFTICEPQVIFPHY